MTGFNARRGAGALAAILAANALAQPVSARTDISPYVEADQVLAFDLSNNDGFGDDVVTYTAIAAGVDASVATRRIEVGASYRYERRIDWDNDIANNDVHSGVLRARANITQGLSFEAGALAARSRAEVGGDGFGFGVGDNDNVTQVYSAYAGPTLSYQAGGLEFGAGYRVGYTQVEDNASANTDPGQADIDYVDHSTTQQATASVGMAPGNAALPFGWIASGGYEREDASQLDQTYEGKYARLDVTVPVTSTLALLGGVGYENIEIGQDDILVDAAGDPVLDNNGRFRSDTNAPRLLAYETDGFIYDAGILWRPNPRLELAARVGKRYDTTIYNGSASYQTGGNSGLNLSVYNTISSFSRGTIDTLAGLPTSFTTGRNAFGEFDGCVYGDAGTGGCFDNNFQSLNASNFRSRGANLVWSGGRGPWNYGVGAGYQNRRYLAPDDAALFSLNGVTDENFALQANLGRQLTSVSDIDGTLFANWFESGIPGETDVFTTGGSATYSLNLYQGLSARASAALFANAVDGEETDWLGSLLLGLRYGF